MLSFMLSFSCFRQTGPTSGRAILPVLAFHVQAAIQTCLRIRDFLTYLRDCLSPERSDGDIYKQVRRVCTRIHTTLCIFLMKKLNLELIRSGKAIYFCRTPGTLHTGSSGLGRAVGSSMSLMFSFLMLSAVDIA